MPHGHIHSCLKSSTSSRTRDTGPQALPALTSTAFRPSGRILLRFHIPSSCRPRVAIIGSREQLCIHPEVSKKESNSEKVGDGTPTEKKQNRVPFFIPKLLPKLTVHPPNLGHSLVLTSLPWLPAVMATSWWLNHSFINPGAFVSGQSSESFLWLLRQRQWYCTVMLQYICSSYFLTSKSSTAFLILLCLQRSSWGPLRVWWTSKTWSLLVADRGTFSSV